MVSRCSVEGWPAFSPPCKAAQRHHLHAVGRPDASPRKPPMTPVDHNPLRITADLKTALTLAELLQRIDASQQSIGPAQYRHLVGHLARLLDQLPHDDRLEALLKAFPAAAALYENQHYVWAGLCRSTLEASLNSELAARQAIDKARSPG